MTTGTTGPDYLVATGPFDDVFGLAGNDTLFSAHPLTVLNGDEGNDLMTTSLFSPLLPLGLGLDAIQNGGEGDDTLISDLEIFSYSASQINNNQAGGEGNDVISANLIADLGSMNSTITGGTATIP